jgi:hypothetical protein
MVIAGGVAQLFTVATVASAGLTSKGLEHGNSAVTVGVGAIEAAVTACVGAMEAASVKAFTLPQAVIETAVKLINKPRVIIDRTFFIANNSHLFYILECVFNFLKL